MIIGQKENESLQVQGDFWDAGNLATQPELLTGSEKYKHQKIQLAVFFLKWPRKIFSPVSFQVHGLSARERKSHWTLSARCDISRLISDSEITLQGFE